MTGEGSLSIGLWRKNTKTLSHNGGCTRHHAYLGIRAGEENAAVTRTYTLIIQKGASIVYNNPNIEESNKCCSGRVLGSLKGRQGREIVCSFARVLSCRL